MFEYEPKDRERRINPYRRQMPSDWTGPERRIIPDRREWHAEKLATKNVPPEVPGCAGIGLGVRELKDFQALREEEDGGDRSSHKNWMFPG